MKEIIKFLIEFVITFGITFIFYYFVLIRQYKKLNEKKVPTEVNIILRFHKIDLKKINYKAMLISLALITSFVISFILTVVYRFFKSNILITVVSLVISIPIALTGYDMVGRYFEKKSKNAK